MKTCLRIGIGIRLIARSIFFLEACTNSDSLIPVRNLDLPAVYEKTMSFREIAAEIFLLIYLGFMYERVNRRLIYHLSQQSDVLNIGQTDIDFNLTAVELS